MNGGADTRREIVRARLRELGFDGVRFARIAGGVAPAAAALEAWLEAGRQADMDWMERTREKRAEAERVLPGARSMILLGVNYWREERGAAAEPHGDARAPRWARYALHDDYHDTIKPALVAAGRALEEVCGATPEDYRYYVDTGPVLERAWAAVAGIGFVGKNAMLISREHGNWLLLAAILTRTEFAPDEPIRKTVAVNRPDGVGLLCGSCTRCLDACPTEAFAGPGVVDARRCISYQTIENKGIIPRELRPGIGARIFGCDVCLEVCPWNRFAQAGRGLLLAARGEIAAVPLRELLQMTPERFAEVFRRTPIKRLKLRGLLRNACIVAGNSGDRSLVAELVALAGHPLPMVRAHAVWAVYRLGAGAALVDVRARETDADVLAEYAASEAEQV